MDETKIVCLAKLNSSSTSTSFYSEDVAIAMAAIGTICTILTFCVSNSREVKNLSFSLYVQNLAVANTMFLFLILINNNTASLLPQDWLLYYFLIYTYCHQSVSWMSSCLMASMSVDRYIMARELLKQTPVYTRKEAKIHIVCLWVFLFCGNGVFLLKGFLENKFVYNESVIYLTDIVIYCILPSVIIFLFNFILVIKIIGTWKLESGQQVSLSVIHIINSILYVILIMIKTFSRVWCISVGSQQCTECLDFEDNVKCVLYTYCGLNSLIYILGGRVFRKVFCAMMRQCKSGFCTPQKQDPEKTPESND